MTTTRRTAERGELSRLLVPLAELASAAGARIREIAAQGAAPRMKADMSPVTAADEAAETILLEGLAKILPGVPVIAEEAAAHGAAVTPAATYLLVDPVDGTRELIAGNREYTVNVALIEAGAPALGIVYAPGFEMLYAGTGTSALRMKLPPGNAARLDEAEPIRVRPRPARLVALVSRSHPDPEGDAFLARLPVERKVQLGSSLKFARVAEGAADVYARFATINEWDVAAGHALLFAAGGRMTAPDGGAITYGKSGAALHVAGFIAWGGDPA